jgi:hypothetical protein
VKQTAIDEQQALRKRWAEVTAMYDDRQTKHDIAMARMSHPLPLSSPRLIAVGFVCALQR